MATADQLRALLRSHADGDEDSAHLEECAMPMRIGAEVQEVLRVRVAGALSVRRETVGAPTVQR